MDKDRILIVEDEPDTLFILSKLLQKNNYDVSAAKNGKVALEMLDSFKPLVVLADWTMPELDGLELCRRMKSSDEYKLIYYIILTARSSVNDRIKGLDVGADDFLIKPTDNQELLARIRSGVRINKLQNELKNIEHSKALIEMACTLGHKMNNPLSSLIFSLTHIEEEIKKSKRKDLDEDFLVVNESIARIRSLVEDLLKLKDPRLTDYTTDSKMLKLD
jgi:sigma-B regulation protein RsbU (phosphoserine phosphatase)